MLVIVNTRTFLLALIDLVYKECTKQNQLIMKKENEKYCSECGSLINIKAEICPRCGVRQALPTTGVNNEGIITLILCLSFGYLGIHRFYTGHIFIGILQILTLGGCGIWLLVDFILIVTGNFKTADGRVLSL